MAERRRGGRIGALVGLAALAGLGFAGGLLAGAAWEEPGLVFGYLLGGTEEVAWGPGREAGLPDVAAEAPAAAEAAATDSPPLGALREKPPRPRVPTTLPSPVASTERMAVQVGAFGDAAAAEKLASSLRARGYAAYVAVGADETPPRWRVRVGPVGTREEADRVASRLKRDEKLPTWVTAP